MDIGSATCFDCLGRDPEQIFKDTWKVAEGIIDTAAVVKPGRSKITKPQAASSNAGEDMYVNSDGDLCVKQMLYSGAPKRLVSKQPVIKRRKLSHALNGVHMHAHS